MKVRCLIVAIVLMFGTTITNAQNKDAVIAKIKSINNAITSIQSKFSQVKTLKMANRKIESEGELYYGKEYYLDMFYNTPKDNVILIDGSRFILKKGSATNKFNTDKNADMRLLRNALINSFAGNIASIAAENDAEIEYEEKDNCHVFSIINSKNKKRMYNGFVIYYDVKTFLMKKITILESNGNFTDYILTGKQIFDKPLTEKRKL